MSQQAIENFQSALFGSEETIDNFHGLTEVVDFSRRSTVHRCLRIPHAAVNRHLDVDWSALDKISSLGIPVTSPMYESRAYLQHLRSWGNTVSFEGLSEALPNEMFGNQALFQSACSQHERIARQNPGARVNALQMAKYLSLTDRNEAALAFSEAVTKAEDLLETLAVDHGSTTYFSASEVESTKNVAEDIAAQLEAIRARSPQYRYLLFSADREFLRIYGGHWAYIAPYLDLMGIRPLILICGDGKEGAALADLTEHLAAFRGSDNPQRHRTSIETISVPIFDGTAEAKTFFASARYIYLPQVLRHLGQPVMVTDIDMTLRDPLTPFLDAMAQYDFACMTTRGVLNLYPWRRYMAGSAWFNASDAALEMAQDIAQYISKGLGCRPSWTLDQNAITYAVERHPGAEIGDVGGYFAKRPIGQDGIRSFYERNVP